MDEDFKGYSELTPDQILGLSAPRAPHGQAPRELTKGIVRGTTFTSMTRSASDCIFVECTFECEKVRVRHSRFLKCEFVRATRYVGEKNVLEECEVFSEFLFLGCDYVRCKLQCCKGGEGKTVSDAGGGYKRDFTGTSFVWCDFTDAKFKFCNFSNSKFFGTKLLQSEFERCDFQNTDLVGGELGPSTRFNDCNCKDMRITKVQLATMEDSGISKGQQIRLNLVDHVAELRQQYSGFQLWFHVIAMTSFLAPYIGFIGFKWAQTFQKDIHETETLIWQLFRFVVNGGKIEDGFRISFAGVLLALIVVFNVLFNVVRGWLLWKTKSLESEQFTKELPVDFKLTDRAIIPPKQWTLFSRFDWSKQNTGWRTWSLTWGQLSTFCKYGLYFNYMLVLLHSLIFLCQQVPK